MTGIWGSIYCEKQPKMGYIDPRSPGYEYRHKTTQTDVLGGSGIYGFFPPTPPIYIEVVRRSQIPPCDVVLRGICVWLVSGGRTSPTLPIRDPPASGYPDLRRTQRSAAYSTKAKTENDEGKTKMGFQNWATPPAFIEWCEREVLPTYGYDSFGLDACAEPHNCKAPRFLAPVGSDHCLGLGCIGFDGLKASWANYGAVWCNPGFSECAKWLDKAATEAERGTTSLVLTHACHGARWFRARLAKATTVWFINPRINFIPPEDVEPSSNNRDSYLWIFSGRCRPTQQFVYPNAWRN